MIASANFEENLLLLILALALVCGLGAVGAWACDWLDEHWPEE